MEGICTCIPETTYVPREYSVAAVLLLLFMDIIIIIIIIYPKSQDIKQHFQFLRKSHVTSYCHSVKTLHMKCSQQYVYRQM